MGNAGFEPGTSAPEVWCANQRATTSPDILKFCLVPGCFNYPLMLAKNWEEEKNQFPQSVVWSLYNQTVVYKS